MEHQIRANIQNKKKTSTHEADTDTDMTSVSHEQPWHDLLQDTFNSFASDTSINDSSFHKK